MDKNNMDIFQVPDNLEQQIMDAMRSFWMTRLDQISKQSAHGVRDQGNRGAVTGGKQLDGFVKIVSDTLILNGVPECCIYTNSDLELPGFFRPNKKWDLLVINQGRLHIAIEFKSQVGPSFGNNFNNRTEEAMGSALDLWTAYKKGVFGTDCVPWIGYFMLLEDCSKSDEPVRVRSPHFNVLSEFVDASYKKRYELFCNKLLLERQYNAVCFVTTSFSKDGIISYNFPKENLSFCAFIYSMLSVAMPYFGRQGLHS